MINKLFEQHMRKTYGDRYDLIRDMDGFYGREIVRRMFEILVSLQIIAPSVGLYSIS